MKRKYIATSIIKQEIKIKVHNLSIKHNKLVSLLRRPFFLKWSNALKIVAT